MKSRTIRGTTVLLLVLLATGCPSGGGGGGGPVWSGTNQAATAADVRALATDAQWVALVPTTAYDLRVHARSGPLGSVLSSTPQVFPLTGAVTPSRVEVAMADGMLAVAYEVNLGVANTVRVRLYRLDSAGTTWVYSTQVDRPGQLTGQASTRTLDVSISWLALNEQAPPFIPGGFDTVAYPLTLGSGTSVAIGPAQMLGEGRSVAVSGAVVAVGGYDHLGLLNPTVEVYDGTGSTLAHTATIVNPTTDDYNFGASVGVTVDPTGTRIVVSHRSLDFGSRALLYRRPSGQSAFSLEQTFVAPISGQQANYFGDVVAIDGDQLVVWGDAVIHGSAPGIFELRLQIYRLIGTTWLLDEVADIVPGIPTEFTSPFQVDMVADHVVFYRMTVTLLGQNDPHELWTWDRA